MLELLLAGLTLSSTAAMGGGGLFSDEPLLDEEPAGLQPTAAELPDFLPRLRTKIELEALTAVDLGFQSGEQVFELQLAGRLEVDAEVRPGLNLYLQPRFRHVTGIDDTGQDRQFLYLLTPEAYASWNPGILQLRAGALVFAWGSSDIIAPNDVLNPYDLRRLPLGATSLADAKIPVLAAEASVRLGPLTVRGVAQPFFSPTRFFLTGWDTALTRALANAEDLAAIEGAISPATLDQAADLIFINERPDDHPGNGTFAGRATLELPNVDLSVTAVYGWDPVPSLRIDPDLVFLGSKLANSVTQGQDFDLLDPEVLAAVERIRAATSQGRTLARGNYERRSMLGFDLSWAVDPLILKLDVSYTFQRTLYTQADYRPVRHPWLTAVVGLEYVYGEDFQLLVEAFAITVFDIRSSYRLMLVEPVAAPPSQFDGGFRTVALGGVIAVARYSLFDGEVQLELGGASTFDRGDFALLPAVRWNASDHHRLALGAIVLGGKAGSYGEIYGDNDQLYLSYVFSP